MATHIRSIVSGKKARTTDGEHNLDLVHLTDRIIIMGWPADGFAGIYRNRRKDVIRYLDGNYGKHYRVFNLCPRNENKYPASEFGGRVSRFPFPDHFAPPLSLLPVVVDRMERWIEEDKKNVIVIHCKAGKGRSGTVAVAYLLSLFYLPELPRGAATSSLPVVPLDYEDYEAQDVAAVMDSKLEYLLEYHTSRRMKPGSETRGVSISSQQRLLRYFARTLSNRDPRPRLATPIRIVKLEWIRLAGPGMTGVIKSLLGGRRIAAQLRRYKDSIASKLRGRELALRPGVAPDSDEEEWDDNEDMLVRVGDVVQPTGGEKSATKDSDTELHSLTLYPATAYRPPSETDEPPFDPERAEAEVKRNGGGIFLDADREIQFRFLVGETGKKHSRVTSMASLAIIWLIPSFESTPDADGLCRIVFDSGKDLDFYKLQWGVDTVEIAWRWIV